MTKESTLFLINLGTTIFNLILGASLVSSGNNFGMFQLVIGTIWFVLTFTVFRTGLIELIQTTKEADRQT